MIFCVVEIIGAYLLLLYCSRKKLGWVMSLYALVFLIIIHTERMISDYGGWHLGINTTSMIQCTHLCGLAWDFADGEAKEDTLTAEQKKNKIDKCPTFIEFFASAFSPMQTIAGPTCNFMDFKNYIYSQGDFANIPSTFIPSMKKFISGMCWVAFYTYANSNFSLELLISPELENKNFLIKVIQILILIAFNFNPCCYRNTWAILHWMDFGGRCKYCIWTNI